MGIPQDIGLSLRAILRCCDAVERLHSTGSMHGMLRPEAFLVKPDEDARIMPPEKGAHLSKAVLPYVAPEQTGRMNRLADSRTDLYSLGVMLYEMLSGAPPFHAEDALSLVHSHLARTPESLTGFGVPAALSMVITKLLSKDPEHRYQTVTGLKVDLKICLSQWIASGDIQPFPTGAQDISSQFRIPARFYGRQRERQVLESALKSAIEGVPHGVTVCGPPGIGKTSLIRQLNTTITDRRCYLASGKFDQQAGAAPYQALVDALKGLAHQFLAEGPQRKEYWRSRLGAALGDQAGVLTEVIPVFEVILGKQPAILPLHPGESQNRFEAAVQSLFRALCSADHPFVLFFG